MVSTMWRSSGGVEADLAVVEPEVVLAELEVFLDRPAQAGDPHQGGQGDRAPGGDVAVVVGQLAGAQVLADEQVVVRSAVREPGPGVGACRLSTRAPSRSATAFGGAAGQVLGTPVSARIRGLRRSARA